MTENIENGDSSNASEQGLDFVLDETLTAEEQVAALKEHNDKVVAANKKLFARAKTAEDKAKTAKPAENKPITTQPGSFEERLELLATGYSDEEIEFLQKNGGKEGLKNPFVKTAIDNIRTQKKAELATIETDSSQSDIERKFTDTQLRNMSVEQLEKILPKA